MNFRKLKANEVECRIASVKMDGQTPKGLSLLLYKDARCDMNILDETVGSEGWQRNHELINGNLFCNVGIKINDEWVWKQDVGTESYTEKEKGQASDSFKRACFNWGIGRELYTAPFIWMPATKCKITNGKCYDHFEVTLLEYSGNVISALEILDTDTKGTYKFGTISAESEHEEDKKVDEMLDSTATEPQKKCIASICEKHKVDLKQLYASNGIKEDTLTKRQASLLINSLKQKFGE